MFYHQTSFSKKIVFSEKTAKTHLWENMPFWGEGASGDKNFNLDNWGTNYIVEQNYGTSFFLVAPKSVPQGFSMGMSANGY